jgi:hypothetical protein
MAEHDDWVEIKHPQVDGVARVAPQSVKHWESRGWSAVSKTEQKKAADTKKEASA